MYDSLRTLHRWRIASDYDALFTSDGTAAGKIYGEEELKQLAMVAVIKAEQVKAEIDKQKSKFQR